MENQILSSKNIIVFLTVIAVLALAMYSIDIVLMLFSAFVINCAISPVVKELEKHIPRIWATTLIVFGLLLVSVLIFAPIIAIVIRESGSLAAIFPNLGDYISKILNFQIFNKSLSDFITFESLKDPLTQGAQTIIQNSIAAGKYIANFFTTMLAIVIIVFYLSYDEKNITNKFIEFFPLKYKDRASKILEDISEKVGNYIFAQGIAMLFVGILTTVGLAILGNEHAFILGFIACIFDIVPAVGPFIAVVLGLLSAISGGIGYVALTLVVYLVVQWAENQFLRPIMFGKMMNMNPLMIIVSLLLCSRFLGFWGLILAPAIASVICVLVDELYLKRIREN